MARKPSAAKAKAQSDAVSPRAPSANSSAAKATVSGARQGPRSTDDPAAEQKNATQELAAAIATNRNKAKEYGPASKKPKARAGG